MDKIQYKGFIINASPQQLVENEQWAVNVHIEKHRGGSVSDRAFSAANTFFSKDEAIEHCLDFGRQIIDGNVIDCSVSDL